MRKLTNRALFICFALMTSFCLIAPATALRSYAQEGGGSTLEGLIKDDSGPLLGATVIVKNTTRGTTTDMDGKFRLEGLQPGDVLQETLRGDLHRSDDTGHPDDDDRQPAERSRSDCHGYRTSVENTLLCCRNGRRR